MKKSHYVFILFFGLLLTACQSSDETQKYAPLVFDESEILSAETKKYISEFGYPADRPYIIRTTDSVEARVIGAVADEYFNNDAELHPNPKYFKKQGVYIFISEYPALVQVRVGEEIKLQAQWGGLTAGSEYIRIQKIAQKGRLGKSVELFIDFTSEKLPEITRLTGFEEFIYNDLTTFLSSEISMLSLPSDSFYGEYMLKPAMQLRMKELTGIGGWWLSYIIIFILAVTVTWLLNRLIFSALMRKAAEGVKNTGKMILSFIIGLGFAVPAVGSAILLSGSRLEDRIALKEMGLDFAEGFSFHPDTFNSPTAWYLALLVFILFFLKSIFQRYDLLVGFSDSPEEQRRVYYIFRSDNPLEAMKQNIVYDTGRSDDELSEFEHAPYTYLFKKHFMRTLYFSFIIAFAAYFFLPKALSLAAIFYWLVVLVKGIIAFFQAAGNKYSDSDTDYTGNIDKLNQELEQRPDDVELLIKRAEALFSAQDWEEALKDYSRAIELEPETGDLYYARASVFEKLGNKNAAVKDYDMAVKYGSDKASVLNDKALLYQVSGQNAKAADIYTSIIQESDKWWLPYYNRGICYFNEQKNEAALADFSEALKLNPKEKDIYRHRAIIYERLGQYEKAADDYTQALSFDKTDASLLYHRAKLHQDNGKLSKAEKDYTAIEEIHKEIAPSDYYPAALRKRAKIYNSQKDYKNAVNDYTVLIGIEPATDIFLLRGMAYTKLQDYDAALSDFNILLEKEPNNVTALSMRGGIYAEKNDAQAAVDDFKKALQNGMNKHPQIMDYINKHTKP
jgi:tetratricopeptide (TPR) repeat protein